MLVKRPSATEPESYIKLFRSADGVKCDRSGAFARSQTLEFVLEISRRLGVCAAEAVFRNDRTGEDFVLPLAYEDTATGADRFAGCVDGKKLCEGAPNGLFYVTIRLSAGEKTSFLSSVNNVDFTLTDSAADAKPFRLLFYADGFETPDWAKRAVMYHVFVDRFARSARQLPVRADSRINPDWEHGVPEYAPYPGAPLANTEFFGGSLYGAAEKLEYLADLGVNCLYLSPIFKARSNHKYDTGDYLAVDEMFGGEAAFDELISKASRLGIRVILDGVFNHTGDDSRTFNRYGRYNSVGAYQSENSPYHDWYFFRRFPDDYECWWGIPILPKLNTANLRVREFFLGERGVVRRYLARGAAGWRLDVADELSAEFLTALRTAAKTEKSDALLLGEVWENAADKIAYGERREYLSGFQLDGVMNYPFRTAVIQYMKTRDCTPFYNTVTEICSSYPPQVLAVVMNFLGTHDTERILTVLGGEEENNLSNDEKARRCLSSESREKGVRLLKIALTLLFTLPGMPSVFYGDEAGLEGYGDPFCRRPYPWGREDASLVAHVRSLARLKRECAPLHGTTLDFLVHEGSLCVYERKSHGECVRVMANLSATQSAVLDGAFPSCLTVLGAVQRKTDGSFVLPPESAAIVHAKEPVTLMRKDQL